MEVEGGVREKPPVLVKRETTAQTLRADYEMRLSHLQESCSHKKTKWMDVYWAPVHYYGRALVRLRCEKRLKMRPGWESVRPLTPKETRGLSSNLRKAEHSFFGLGRGIGPFSQDDEASDHD